MKSQLAPAKITDPQAAPTARRRSAVTPKRNSAGGSRKFDWNIGTIPVFPRSSSKGEASSLIQEVLREPGIPLDSPTRSFFEPRLGHDFGKVRLHSDVQAAQSAEAIQASAYTLGSHIVFAAGKYAPQSAEGRQLLAHELTHVRQHAALGSSAMVARQPAKAPTIVPPVSASFKDLFRQFELTLKLAEKKPLALAALNALNDADDEVQSGIQLANFFLEQGMAVPAQTALEKAQSGWILKHVTKGTGVPLTLGRGGGPDVLITRAKEAARADNHTLAFQLFGLAYQLLQFQAEEAGPAREEKAEADMAKARTPDLGDFTVSMGRTFHYATLKSVYDRMRDILGFYYELEAASRTAGDTQRAAYYSGMAYMLFEEIRDKWIWADTRKSDERGDQTRMGEQLAVAEVGLVQKGKRDALRIFGANSVNVDVDALPGLPPPREVTPSPKAGSITYQSQEVGALTQALYGQVSLMAEVNAIPAVQKEFGDHPIDMQNLQDRLRLWRVMYRQYQKEDTLKLGALHSLMSLIGRYLKAFTIHTTYNVPDFGKSYLDDNMNTMPSDLAGRLERDCGVYALTVAYEVFRTAREAAPRLAVDFKIYTMPDHVALVIRDNAQKEYYVVNNDEVSPAKNGDPDRDVANLYQAIPKVKSLITPEFTATIGSTSMTDDAFKKQAWQNYEDASSWGLHVEPKPGQVPAEAKNEAFKNFYETQLQFDKDAKQLDLTVDRLVAALASATTPAAKVALINRGRDAFRAQAMKAAGEFYKYGPGVSIDTSRPDPKLLARLKSMGGGRYLYTSERPGSPHPIARSAMAMLFFASLADPLSNGEKAVLDLCSRVDAFKAAVEEYKAAGLPASF